MPSPKIYNCKKCQTKIAKNSTELCINCFVHQPKSEEHKRKIAKSNRGKHNHLWGKTNPNWKDGITKPKKVECKECGKIETRVKNKTNLCNSCNSRIKNTGQIFTKKRKENIKKALLVGYKEGRIISKNKGKHRPEFFGFKNPNFRGGITPIYNLVRSSIIYKGFLREARRRDNFVCRKCGIQPNDCRKLHVHHIKSFAQIINENNLKSMEEAINCFELWDINNLVTLCEDCHRKTENYARHTRLLISNLNT